MLELSFIPRKKVSQIAVAKVVDGILEGFALPVMVAVALLVVVFTRLVERSTWSRF